VRYPVPPYFDYLIEAFERGEGGRHVHLGYWDQPPRAGDSPTGFEQAQQRLDAVLLELADLADGQALLDVGCGFGGTLARVNEQRRDMRLTGLNIDPRQLAICRTIAPHNGNVLRWQRGDACRLPFTDASFDRVLCFEAMFHFPSRRTFFCEAARVLRPGGVLVASDIVLQEPVGPRRLPPYSLQDALQTGFGPWPDPWGRDADHAELAGASGLGDARIVDLSANVAPSHRFTTPPAADPLQDPGDDGRRAALALAWLQGNGLLRYLGIRAVRRPARP
jgi:SAM-dependent methyltransferase